MDRRDFLKSTAAAGIAGTALVTPDRARAALPPPASSPADLDRFLSRFDRGLQAIDRGGLLAGLLPPGVRLDGPRAREGEALFRRSLRTLYATGSFLELAPADQLHPGVQSRLRGLLPEIDGTVEAHQRLLAGLRPEDHAMLQRHLQGDPGLPLRLAEVLDDAAIANDLAPSKRGRLRLAATEMGTRLRTQPPSLFIGEYLEKARRMQEREADAGATERVLMARLGEEGFWEYRSWAEREALAWRERLAAEGSAGDEPADPAPIDDESSMPLSAKAARRGAKLLGIGIGVGGLCAVTQAGGMNVLIVGVTVGVVLVLIGLVLLLTAGIRRIGERADDMLDADGKLRPEFRAAPAPPPAPEPPPPPPPQSPFLPQ
jgi:hypothetical protein